MKTFTEITKLKNKHLRSTPQKKYFASKSFQCQKLFSATSLKSSKLCHFCKLQLQIFLSCSLR